jgi:hypothetical protein
MAVGSLKAFGRVEPKSPVKAGDSDEEQPFPEAEAPIDGRGVSAPVSPDPLRRVRAAPMRAQVKGPVLAGAKPALQTARFSGWY